MVQKKIIKKNSKQVLVIVPPRVNLKKKFFTFFIFFTLTKYQRA